MISLDFRLVFNGNSKAVVRLNSCLYQCVDKRVGERKIVGRRVVFVRVKASEYVGNVNENSASEKTSYVVRS